MSRTDVDVKDIDVCAAITPAAAAGGGGNAGICEVIGGNLPLLSSVVMSLEVRMVPSAVDNVIGTVAS